MRHLPEPKSLRALKKEKTKAGSRSPRHDQNLKLNVARCEIEPQLLIVPKTPSCAVRAAADSTRYRGMEYSQPVEEIRAPCPQLSKYHHAICE